MAQDTALQVIISIHALREEGDITSAVAVNPALQISIHALREEGDALRWPRVSG